MPINLFNRYCVIIIFLILIFSFFTINKVNCYFLNVNQNLFSFLWLYDNTKNLFNNIKFYQERINFRKNNIINKFDDCNFQQKIDSLYFLEKNQLHLLNFNIKNCLPLNLSFDKNWDLNLSSFCFFKKLKSNRKIKDFFKPIIIKNNIYIFDCLFGIVSFSRSSGKILWRTNLRPKGKIKGFGGGILYVNNYLLIITPFGKMFFLNANTGLILWEKILDNSVVSLPVINNGKIFIININDILEVFDMQTGLILWKRNIFFNKTGMVGSKTFIIKYGFVIISYVSGKIFALCTSSGYKVWEKQFKSISLLDSNIISSFIFTPIVKKGIIYIFNDNGYVSALDIFTGRFIWNKRYFGIQNPILYDDLIFLLLNNNKLLCIKKYNGYVKWIKSLYSNINEIPVWSGPFIFEKKIFFINSASELFCFKLKNGKKGRLGI